MAIDNKLKAVYNKVALAIGTTNEFVTALPDCYDAVEAKGGTLPAQQTAANLSTAIASIPNGKIAFPPPTNLMCQLGINSSQAYGLLTVTDELASADWTQVKSVVAFFANNAHLTTIKQIQFGVLYPSMAAIFQKCYRLVNGIQDFLDGLTFESAVTSMEGTFSDLRCINGTGNESVDLTSINIANNANWNNCFNGSGLKTIKIDKIGTGGVSFIFNGCTNLYNLYVNFIPAHANSAYMGFNQCNNLTHDSLVRIIDALESSATTHTLNIGSTNLAKLSSDEIAVATAKNWTVA